jgi:elongation factor 1 alpha-like protein
MGRLLYDLKVVDEASMERLRRDSKKIGKSSFALAWVMDATADERERGITVDIATNHFETDKTRFTILDAPGHQDFIPNMIAGASQADFAVLVIDASTNSFESGLRGQTREHAMLVRSMGVHRLIVAVNKMDMCNWSEERFTEIRQQMSSFLEIANFKKESISFVPCSGLKGENIIRPIKDIPEAKWYTGPTLVEELDNAEPTKRALDKPLRMTISEVFRTSPNNPISVSGKLDAGSLQAGDIVTIAPSGEKATIKSLEADGQPSEWAVAGQIAVLNLTDVDLVHLRNGDILCHPATAIKNLKTFTAKILAIDHVMPMFVEVHRGPLHVPGKITTLVATLDKQSGNVARKRPKVVQPGSVARVVVELESEMPLESPNKVILRSEGKTVAAGLME